MANGGSIEGKRILVVDDEPDILESIQDSLEMCHVDTAADFESAERLLNTRSYDIAVLDIMGVNGYGLLALSREKHVPAVMLTAHALSPDNFSRAMQGGARAYLPKDKLAEIDTFLADVLGEKSREPGALGKWFDRVKSYYEAKFGKGWLEEWKGSWQ